jgi:hypothetical protein
MYGACRARGLASGWMDEAGISWTTLEVRIHGLSIMRYNGDPQQNITSMDMFQYCERNGHM